MQNTSPRPSNRYEQHPFAHATTQQQRVGSQLVSTSIYSSGVHLHQTRHVCARLVGPFRPRKKRNGAHGLTVPLAIIENCFLRLHGIHSISVTNHLANNIPFCWFQSSLEGFETRPLRNAQVSEKQAATTEKPRDKICQLAVNIVYVLY